MKRYANAEKILPTNLLREIQKYHVGVLWIPDPSLFFQERKEMVIALKQQGVETKEIAGLADITVRRVNQILAKNRKENEIRHLWDGSGR